MCNAYEVGGQAGSSPGFLRADSVRSLAANGKKRLIRRTDLAPVVTAQGLVQEMSWGFRREGLGVINNSRADKLTGPMWRQPYQVRRCLIPVAGYYEWKGPKGKKQTYRFQATSGAWLWIAGLWEEDPNWGKCFSMITTEASPQVLPIHHRMPAALREDQGENFLAGGEVAFGRDFAETLFAECANPLLKKASGPKQGELF